MDLYLSIHACCSISLVVVLRLATPLGNQNSATCRCITKVSVLTRGLLGGIPLEQSYVFFFYSLIPRDVNLVTVLRHLKRDAVTHVKMLEKLIEEKVGLYLMLMTSNRY